MSYHEVPPRSIRKTIVSTLTHTVADLLTKSRVITIEASVPVNKIGSNYSILEADIGLNNPYVFSGVKGFLSLTSSGSFRVIVTDNLTAETVNFMVDKLFVFHGISDSTYTLQTDDTKLLKVTILRVN